MHGSCHVWSRLIEFSSVALNCLTLSRLTAIPDVSLIQSSSPRLEQPVAVQGDALFNVMGQES